MGNERIFGNCGSYPGLTDDWRFMMRFTAAHATAIIADTNSSELIEGGGLEYPASNVHAARAEQEGATWLEASHDGYRSLFGVTHRRRLWLAADGADGSATGGEGEDGSGDSAAAVSAAAAFSRAARRSSRRRWRRIQSDSALRRSASEMVTPSARSGLRTKMPSRMNQV